MINKNMRGYSTIVLGVIIMALGLAVGYVAGGSEKNEPEPPAIQKLDAEGMGATASEERYAVVSVNSFSCGHVIERNEGLDKSMSEAKGLLGSDCIYDAKDGKLTVHRKFAYCCPQHYYAAGEGNALAVYKTDGDTLEQSEVCRLDIGEGGAQYAEISAGMAFDGLEQINLYLEGLDE